MVFGVHDSRDSFSLFFPVFLSVSVLPSSDDILLYKAETYTVILYEYLQGSHDYCLFVFLFVGDGVNLKT